MKGIQVLQDKKTQEGKESIERKSKKTNQGTANGFHLLNTLPLFLSFTLILLS